MQILRTTVFLLLLLLISAISASGFGSMGPISAAFGDHGFFCAIDASGKQQVICWNKNNSSPSSSSSSTTITIAASSASTSLSSLESASQVPPMAALSGGEGFLCGLLANTSQAFCWSLMASGMDLVPSNYKTTAYSHIASGKNHVCGIRGAYYSDHGSGTVDCWEIVRVSNDTLSSKQSSLFYNQSISNLDFNKIVSGEGFSCGGIRGGGLVCWGPNADLLGVSNVSESFLVLASAKGSICGIMDLSGEVRCWGDSDSFSDPGPPIGVRFISLTAGAYHFCGIREDNHGVECWGSFNYSSVPKHSGFVALASSDFTTCGIREDDLVLDCWSRNTTLQHDYNPPLELCSPGLCRSTSCLEGEFAFNASNLNEPDLTSLCVRNDLHICSPCASDCSAGFFLSSPCTKNADRICTACSLCQNSSCWDVCGLPSSPEKHWHHMIRLVIIGGSCVFGFLLILLSWCYLPCMFAAKTEEGTKKQFKSCIGKPDQLDGDATADSFSPVSITPCPGTAQIFRLSELKDATNGFKEFNELGRGSYGFVYKAVLADGRQVAVKRANAATIIQTNSHWGARITDFRLVTSSERNLDPNGDMKSDVYSFGIVLLEILSGRKAYDRDYTPASIVDWAVPLIKQGKAAAIIDCYHALPRNVEPLLKLADIAELAVREDPGERPTMSDMVILLQQIAKDGLIL
ncbi:hypothetical protein V6N13_072732 [Hibiscus sabdariffa]